MFSCAPAEQSAMPDGNAGVSDRSAVLQLTARIGALETELAALHREVDAVAPKVHFFGSS